MPTVDRKTEPPKSILKSKTAFVNLVVALATLYPPVANWIAANPEAFATLVALLNLALRYATKGRVEIFKK